ncbi:MAG: AAA family ATPase, partial [Thermofilaceae archaeon]
MERLSLRDFARLFELEKIVVRNFKSLMDLELSFPTRVTVIAGPNGSGKTALVEALELLKEVQEWAKGHTANPFSKWWGYRNVVYRHDEARSITIGLKLKLNREKLEEKLAALNRGEDLGTIFEKVYLPVRDFMERLDAALKLLSASELTVYYETSLKGLHRFSVEDEVFKLEAGLLSIDGSFARKKFSINVNFRELIKSENLIPAAMPIYRSILKTRLKTDVLNREEFYLWMLGIIKSEIIGSLCTEDWMSGILRLTIKYDELLFETLVYPYYDGLRGVINWHDELVDIFEESISNAIDEALEKQREALISRLRSSTKLSELSKKIQNAEELILNALRILLEIVAYGLAVIIAGAAVGIWEFIEGIVVLRGVKFSELKTPQPLTREEALRSDGSNLAPYLYTITEGRIPEQIEEALAYVLEGCGEVKLSMPVTDDGRVYISIQVDGVKLPPPSQPDGALKALLVEAALLSKPSMIAIDEFENSLHPLAQQFLIDEIRSSGAYAIITT